MAEQKFKVNKNDRRLMTQSELIRKENERRRTQDRRNRRKMKQFAQ